MDGANHRTEVAPLWRARKFHELVLPPLGLAVLDLEDEELQLRSLRCVEKIDTNRIDAVLQWLDERFVWRALGAVLLEERVAGNADARLVLGGDAKDVVAIRRDDKVARDRAGKSISSGRAEVQPAVARRRLERRCTPNSGPASAA